MQLNGNSYVVVVAVVIVVFADGFWFFMDLIGKTRMLLLLLLRVFSSC